MSVCLFHTHFASLLPTHLHNHTIAASHEELMKATSGEPGSQALAITNDAGAGGGGAMGGGGGGPSMQEKKQAAQLMQVCVCV